MALAGMQKQLCLTSEREEKPYRVLELAQVGGVLPQDSFCALLEACHPLVIAKVCNVGLREQERGECCQGRKISMRDHSSVTS